MPKYELNKDEMRTLKITENLLLIYGVFVFLYAVVYFIASIYGIVWASFWLYGYFFFLGLLLYGVGYPLIFIFSSFMFIHARKLLQERNVNGCYGGIFGLLIVVLPMLISFPGTFKPLDKFLYNLTQDNFESYVRAKYFLGFCFLFWVFFNFILFYLLFSVKYTLKKYKEKNPTNI